MRRVLFISRKWPPAIGGMETYAVKLCEALALRCELETRVLPGRAQGTPPSLVRLAVFLMGSFPFLLRRRAYVVHIGDLVLWPLALAARWFRTAPHVAVTAYGLDVIYGRRGGLLPKLYGVYLKLGARLVGRHVKVIAISHETARLCRDAGFTRIDIVTLGVDNAVAPIGQLHSTGKFILFVGRLVRRKGASWFVRNVLPLLPPDLHFIVVGKPWDPDELDAVRGDERVEYRDYVSDADLSALRRGAIAVVMPNVVSEGTDVEGFGLAAVEAGADGGVLLASGIEGLVDAVVDGATGFLLPTADAAAWAAKIQEITDWNPEKRAAFLRECQEAIATRFTWQAVADRTLEAYISQPKVIA
jgi:phosphatidylinositol alpha-1,6-mannosyltransferase